MRDRVRVLGRQESYKPHDMEASSEYSSSALSAGLENPVRITAFTIKIESIDKIRTPPRLPEPGTILCGEDVKRNEIPTKKGTRPQRNAEPLEVKWEPRDCR